MASTAPNHTQPQQQQQQQPGRHDARVSHDGLDRRTSLLDPAYAMMHSHLRKETPWSSLLKDHDFGATNLNMRKDSLNVAATLFRKDSLALPVPTTRDARSRPSDRE